jgi:hypothetical protein
MFIRYYLELPFSADQVAVSPGAPVRFPSMTSLPLTWEPVGMEGLFPRLEADLQIGPLGGERTQLAISARCRPPLGAVGRAVERKPPRPASPVEPAVPA